jgi:ribosome-binding factor A
MRASGRDNRKQAQLCAQVEQIASLALGSSRDPRLNQLMVHSVEASADGARLTVNVIPGDEGSFESLESLMDALNGARTWLRHQIAEEIVRKRTPEIKFEFIVGVAESED